MKLSQRRMYQSDSIARIALVVVLVVTLAGCVGDWGQPAGSLLVTAHVLTDDPAPGSGYERREGQPRNIGVYEFYLKEPGSPGSGAFRRLDTVSLHKLDEGEFYGQKSVKKIDGCLCIGYPSTNIIDGKACVEIDQSEDDVDIIVHYWKTRLGVL